MLLSCISLIQITYAPWPTSPYHDNFFEDYISGHPYEHRYSFVREKSLQNTSTEERLADAEQIFKNFVKVQVYPDGQHMMEYEVRPQVSPTAFLSQLGGALNLWAGITVVVVIELLELVYRVLVDCRTPERKESGIEPIHNETPRFPGAKDKVQNRQLIGGNMSNAFGYM